VTHYELPYFEALAQWVEKGNLDVVQVHYSIATRQAEERIIPAAADRGTAVAVNMPLEKARLHKLGMEVAKALCRDCIDVLGLREDRLNVEFTQHAGDEMYHPTLGGYSPEWTPREA
jgi:aryl-alcohol dehydrogenase-like predicted oxidoreductase